MAFNLQSLLQPFNQQSPINMMSMMAQTGLRNPGALASLMAAKGVEPPAIKSPAAGPSLGAAAAGRNPAPPGFSWRINPQTGELELSPDQTPLPGIGIPTPSAPQEPAPILPAQQTLPRGTPQSIPGAPSTQQKTGMEGILEALGALQAPPKPDVPLPPSPIAPRPGGPGPDTAMLAALTQLLRGGGVPTTPTLGQLISGGGGASRPTLAL